MTVRQKMLLAVVAGFCAMFLQQPAQAQLSSEPFSFDNDGTSGLGMSNAGRQAILNKELFGVTPDHMAIGPGDVLIEITQGPGRAALANLPDGTFLPGYKGAGLELGGLSVFYDAPTRIGGYAGFVIHGNSQAVINAWTFGVLIGAYEDTALANHPAYTSYNTSSVDSWVAQVPGLPAI
jgi:hypothetical protein